MTTQTLTPTRFLSLLRKSDPKFMVDLYTNGGCYHLFTLLQAIWPEAEAWFSAFESHVYTKIGSGYYDIEGRYTLGQVRAWASDLRRMTQDEQREAGRLWLARRFSHVGQGNMVHRWAQP